MTYTIEQLKDWYQPFSDDIRAPRHCGDSTHIIQDLISEIEARDRQLAELQEQIVAWKERDAKHAMEL